MAEAIDSTKRRMLKSAALAVPAAAMAGVAQAGAWAHPMDGLPPSQKSFAMAAMRAVTELVRTSPLALAALGPSPVFCAVVTSGYACGLLEHEHVLEAMAGVAEGTDAFAEWMETRA